MATAETSKLKIAVVSLLNRKIYEKGNSFIAVDRQEIASGGEAGEEEERERREEAEEAGG